MTPEEKADRDRHNAARLAPRMTLADFVSFQAIFLEAAMVAAALGIERHMLGLDPPPPPSGILPPANVV